MPLEFGCLLIFLLGLIGGWGARKDYLHIKSEQVQANDEEFIKQINRNNLINTWVAERKGEVKR